MIVDLDTKILIGIVIFGLILAIFSEYDGHRHKTIVQNEYQSVSEANRAYERGGPNVQ